MMRHVLTVQTQSGPLMQARLLSVLRTRRVPFAIGFAMSDGGDHTTITVIVDAEPTTVERVVLHLERVVGVRTVTRHEGTVAIRAAVDACISQLNTHVLTTTDPAVPEESV